MKFLHVSFSGATAIDFGCLKDDGKPIGEPISESAVIYVPTVRSIFELPMSVLPMSYRI